MSAADDAETSGIPSLRGVGAVIPWLSGATSGRVPRQSVLLVTTLTVLVVLGVGVAGDAAVFAAGGLGVGGLIAITIAVADYTDVVKAAFGGVGTLTLVCVAGGILAGALITAGSAAAGIVAGALIAGFGVVCLRVRAIGNGTVAQTIGWVLRVAILTAVVAVVTAAGRVDISAIPVPGTDGSLATLLTPGGTTAVATGVGFVGLCASVFGSVWLLTATAPPPEAISERRRDQYRRVISVVRIVVGAGFVAGGTLLALIYVGSEQLQSLAGVVTPVIGIVESNTLRQQLVRLAVVTLAFVGVVRLVRSTGTVVLYRQPAWLGSALVVNAVVLAAAFAGGSTIVTQASASLPAGGSILETTASIAGAPAAGVGLITVALVGLSFALVVLPILTGAGILPALTAGPRLVLVGVSVATAAYASGGGSPIVATAAVTAGLVAWNVGAHAATVTRDVGTTPAARDGALVHAGWSLSVGVTAVALTVLTRVLLGSGTLFEEQVLTVTALGTSVGVVLAVLLWTR